MTKPKKPPTIRRLPISMFKTSTLDCAVDTIVHVGRDADGKLYAWTVSHPGRAGRCRLAIVGTDEEVPAGWEYLGNGQDGVGTWHALVHEGEDVDE